MAKTAPNKSAASVKRKPKLGQNFLTDFGAARRIVEALGDVSNRTVIEIGPGRGVLTDVLVSRAKRVIGIELDPTFVFGASALLADGHNDDVRSATGRREDSLVILISGLGLLHYRRR